MGQWPSGLHDMELSTKHRLVKGATTLNQNIEYINLNGMEN